MTICEFSWLDSIIYVYTFYHMLWYYIIGLYMDLSHYVYLPRAPGRAPPQLMPPRRPSITLQVFYFV